MTTEYTDPHFLYIHGMQEDAQVWRKLIDALDGSGTHLAAEFPWNHTGQGSWVHADEGLANRLCIPVRQFLGAHPGPRIVVAHSFGSLALLEYLHGHGTGDFDAIVLIAPFHCFPSEPLDWAKLQSLGEHYQRFLQECVAVRVATRTQADIVSRMAEHVRERIGPVGCIEFLHHYHRSARIDLAEIDLPVLVLAGAHDYYCSRREAQMIAAAFPDGRDQLLAGTGHFCMLDKPHEAAGHILDFLADTLVVQPIAAKGTL
jgi:pimeloyl-ACP methyl ester carboxylesterase